FLHRDDIALHAGDLGHRDHAPRAVLEAAGLHDQVDGAGDLGAHRLDRHLDPGHGDHVLQTADAVAGRVGVDRGHRPVVAGVHGLEHVDDLLAAGLADDDAVGPHPERVPETVALGDGALA